MPLWRNRVQTTPTLRTKRLQPRRRRPISISCDVRRWLRSAPGWRGGAPHWPQLLDVAPWPYILLGCGYASLAIGLSIVGAQRQRALEHALRTGGHAPLRFRTVAVFTVGSVALAVLTVVL